MRRFLPLTLVLAMSTASANPRSADILPYAAVERTLENGLKVIVVPTGFPNLVSLQIPVKTGSRNEVEPGKSGFAHFFEHMMFRGTKAYPPAAYQAIVTRMGARQNAYTTDDYTNYHVTFAKEDLEQILELEADRFQHLDYPLASFQTEARNVLGEYNKNFSNPIRKLFEVMQDTAYTTHPYKHTTMGFLDDIVDMPNQFEYSRTFFRRWYRPEYATVIIAGDVDPEAVLPLVEKHFGSWQRGDGDVPEIPQEPAPEGPKVAHVPWPTPTLPLLAISFHGPAFSTTQPDAAAIDLLLQARFGPTSDLYRKLVVTEQLVDSLAAFQGDNEDPGLITILARPKDGEKMLAVRDAILATVAACRHDPVSAQVLADTKKNVRYGLAATLDNTESIASLLARYVRFERSYDTLNQLFRLYETLTAEQLLAAARTYFTDARMVVTTLSHGDAPANVREAPTLEAFAAPRDVESLDDRLLIVRSQSPQVVFKLQFAAGAAADPPGKEGLAALTAAMVAEAGSDVLSWPDVQKALYPMAGRFDATVSKEVTVFTGSIHRDNLDHFATIVFDMLFHPGLRPEDFQRNQDAQKNALVQDLIANDDEELGKELLQAALYEGTRYGHPNAGTQRGIAGLTVDDVRKFHAENYTLANLSVGVSGDMPDAFLERLRAELSANLPEGNARAPQAVAARRPSGMHVDVIAKETRGTAVSFGHPIEVTRSHPDWVALHVARTWLGEHRSSMSHLYDRIREIRGMNYGDYAYIEQFPNGGRAFFPPPHQVRSSQLFEVWLRPLDKPEYAHHALRIALHELQKLIENGLTPEQFAATRDYLMKNVYLLTDGQARDLGYRMDSDWYDIPEYTAHVRSGLAALTVEDVNAAIAKHLDWKNVHVVMITRDADQLTERLLSDAPSKMDYEGEKPAELLEEDRIVGARALGLDPDRVRVIPVSEVFGG